MDSSRSVTSTFATSLSSSQSLLKAMTPEPNERRLDRFAGTTNEDAVRAIMIMRMSAEMQERVEVIAHKSREGVLTAEEHRQYESYADTVAMICLLQAHARRVLSHAGKL